MEYFKKCILCNSANIKSIDLDCDISRCYDCGFIFHNPVPIFTEIQEFYSKEDKYNAWIKEEQGKDVLCKRRLALVKKYKKNGSLLDIGSGIGQFLIHARNDFEICGTEVSEIAVRIAKERYNINLIKGRLEEIDFQGRKFDVITIFHVLEHLFYLRDTIRKCHSLLSEKGVIIIAVPNEIHSLFSIIKFPIKYLLSKTLFIKVKKYGWRGISKINLSDNPDEVHISFFTSKTLRKLLLDNKFKIIDENLDPYYSTVGVKRFVDEVLFFIFLSINKIFKINLYETIWMTAKCR